MCNLQFSHPATVAFRAMQQFNRVRLPHCNGEVMRKIPLLQCIILSSMHHIGGICITKCVWQVHMYVVTCLVACAHWVKQTYNAAKSHFRNFCKNFTKTVINNITVNISSFKIVCFTFIHISK